MLDYQGFKKAVGTSSAEGWVSGVLPSVSSVTYNGNRSYDITFAGPIDTYLSPGMRLKTVRQVTAPTQCTSLNGTNQYWSRASASLTNMSFTNNFTFMAWIKLSSYAAYTTIMGRQDATPANGWTFDLGASGDRLRINIFNAGAGNYRNLSSYQSVPLNKWIHVAATWTSGTVTMYFDGTSVPVTGATTGGTAPTVCSVGTDFAVGRAGAFTASTYFPGKIAQAAVFSAVLSEATIKSYYSQGLSGSEANLVSAFSMNGTGNDLSANANNLTAQGSATATNADSPFSVNGSGTATGTDDYAIVQAVTSTVATVSLPAGCTIPTSGGVSATYTSTQKNPFNWVTDKDRWEILTRNRLLIGQSSPVNGTYYNIGSIYLNVPKGIWDLRYDANTYSSNSVATTQKVLTTLSTLTNNESDRRYTWDLEFSSVVSMSSAYSVTNTVTLTNATTYYLLAVNQATSTIIYFLGDRAETAIKALPSGL